MGLLQVGKIYDRLAGANALPRGTHLLAERGVMMSKCGHELSLISDYRTNTELFLNGGNVLPNRCEECLKVARGERRLRLEALA